MSEGITVIEMLHIYIFRGDIIKVVVHKVGTFTSIVVVDLPIFVEVFFLLLESPNIEK